MTIIQDIQQRPCHHDYNQTKTTSDYNRQFSNQCDRCKMLKVVHCNRSDTQPSIPLLYIYIYIIQYYSSTRKHPKFSLPYLACTNITCTLLLSCALKLLLLLLRQTKSNKITSDTDGLTNCWFFAGIICCCCWSLLYADLNRYNTRNYQLMRTLTTLQ